MYIYKDGNLLLPKASLRPKVFLHANEVTYTLCLRWETCIAMYIYKYGHLLLSKASLRPKVFLHANEITYMFVYVHVYI